MDNYEKLSGLKPDFLVSYKLIPASEGGRKTPPFQHIRWDWLYDGDDPAIVSMIHPEAIDEKGEPFPEGPIPDNAYALMFILDTGRRGIHATRIKEGVKGFFVEGSRKVATCTAIKVLSIHENLTY